jgi:hypothetical protein
MIVTKCPSLTLEFPNIVLTWALMIIQTLKECTIVNTLNSKAPSKSPQIHLYAISNQNKIIRVFLVSWVSQKGQIVNFHSRDEGQV